MARASILVVEDEVITAIDLRIFLINLGYSVPAVVSSGEAAVAKAEEFRPDVVLMDIILKGEMDGVEAAGQIRQRFDIPVVFITGAYIDGQTFERVKKTRPAAYIRKPADEGKLRAGIEQALEEKRSAQGVDGGVDDAPDIRWEAL